VATRYFLGTVVPLTGSTSGNACHFIGKYVEVKADKKLVLQKMKEKITVGEFDQRNDKFMIIPYHGNLNDGSLFGGAALVVVQPNWMNQKK
nr:hypothetical protein [Thermoanaerobaculia bacterium]HUM30293.1 hypothetical protein [Thermoanaerobaculia bacterium]HXK68556.1 hypothetical protein [Thermoanaerobaculia bacterium]